MPEIKYARPTECQSLGRNGYCATLGLAVTLIHLNHVDEVHFEPITTRGVGRARIVVSMDALPALISCLQSIDAKSRSGETAGKSAGGPASSYQVDWRIDIDADSSMEAAAKALTIQRDPESIATEFLVTDRNGLSEVVDLSEVVP